MEEKGGGKGPKLFPKRCPPVLDISGGQQLYSCKVCIARNMAGHLLELQVAGRPPPLAGRLGVKKVKFI